MVSSSDLIKFFELRSIKYDDVKLKTWQEFFNKYDDNLVRDGLLLVIEDTSIINPNVGDILDKIKKLTNSSQEQIIEKEWQECLKCARAGGYGEISARSAKALASLGGMMWLRNADPDKTEWQRKEFIEVYKITPEPKSLDFRCFGLIDKPYLKIDDTNLLE